MSPILREVRFKNVWTTDTHVLYIDPSWSVNRFIEFIQLPIHLGFNIFSSFEIIETGQELAENAPALQGDSVKLSSKWGDDLDVSFYVKFHTIQQPSDNVSQHIQDECPICFESIQLISRNGCSHRVCADCNERCQQVNYTICPVCRHE
jgi:hypothetical protein